VKYKRTNSRLQRAMSGLVPQPNNRPIGLLFFSSWPAVGPYSILGTDNRLVGLIFFLFLACSRPLVGSRSIGPTDNRPSGLINFYLFIYFVFVRGPQSGPFKFLARF